jgi:hypothetical protein
MSWSNKDKSPDRIDRGRLLTPDGNQILVGPNEDEILIYQEETDLWTRKQREA